MILLLAAGLAASSCASWPWAAGGLQAGPVGGSSQVRKWVEPDPAAPGAPLTYTVEVSWAPGGPLPVRDHLPPGVSRVRARGTGWSCRAIAQSADAYQPAEHMDVECFSLIVATGQPVSRIVIEVDAPLTAGAITNVVVVGKEPFVQEARVTSTVDP